MANEIRSVWTAEDRMSRTIANIDRNVSRLDRTFTGFRARLVNAFQYRYIRAGFRAIEQAIFRVARAIPDLIGRGQAWLDVIDDITDATGASARMASELAAVQRYVGGSTDGLSKALVVLARNAVTNRDAFDALGIATRDSNGHMLDAGTILLNVRRRISETGQGLLSTAAAQKVFGRGAAELLDLLSLTDKQYRLIAQDARRAGLIVTESQLRQANVLRNTQRRFEAVLDGLASTITIGLLPTLTSIIEGISDFIQRNLEKIRQFAVDVVNFVGGILSALFGFEFGGVSFAEEVDKAGKNVRKHGPGLRDFSRDQERAKNETRDHAKELKRLREELRAAQRELAAARASDIFRPGVSGVDEALFDQARITRIRTARKRVADAEKALRRGRRGGGGFEPPDAIGRRLRLGGGFTRGGAAAGISGEAARMFGQQVGDAILDALLGARENPGEFVPPPPGGHPRSGGLIPSLNNLQASLDNLAKGPLSWLKDAIDNLVLEIRGLFKIVPDVVGVPTPNAALQRMIDEARSNPLDSLGMLGLVSKILRRGGHQRGDGGIPGFVLPPPPGMGFNAGTGLASFAQRYLLDSTFRKFFGPSSDLLRGQEDQSGLLSWLTANTQPMADGAVGVTNPQFPQIGRVTQWGAGTLDVWTPGGKKLPVEGDWDVKLGGSPANNIYETRKNTSKTVNLLAHWLPQINKRGVEIRNVLQSAQSGDTSLRVRVT